MLPHFLFFCYGILMKIIIIIIIIELLPFFQSRKLCKHMLVKVPYIFSCSSKLDPHAGIQYYFFERKVTQIDRSFFLRRNIGHFYLR